MVTYIVCDNEDKSYNMTHVCHIADTSYEKEWNEQIKKTNYKKDNW